MNEIELIKKFQTEHLRIQENQLKMESTISAKVNQILQQLGHFSLGQEISKLNLKDINCPFDSFNQIEEFENKLSDLDFRNELV